MPPARTETDHSTPGGSAPFLLKTYDMVAYSSTDNIVSWSPSGNSFVVWDPPEFARLLLPTYFKHNNFSSFIRQLNTYGFRKIDPEKWEFANEDFVKGEKHLLKNIHRRKPVHSHSYPQGSTADPEKIAFKEEMERLSREKAALEFNILKCKRQGSITKIQVDDLTCRYRNMEQRQEKLLSFLENAIQDPIFAVQLARKMECMNGSADKKKRWLPVVEVPENICLDSDRGSAPDVGAVFGQDFADDLRLNLGISCSQSCDNDGLDLERIPFEGKYRDAGTRIEYCLFAPEAVDLSELRSDSSMLQNMDTNGSSGMSSLQEISLSEEVDGNVCCRLTLASYNAGLSERSRTPWEAHDAYSKESPNISFPNDRDMASEELVDPAPPVRVNDVFWEQFLTEKPTFSSNIDKKF